MGDIYHEPLTISNKPIRLIGNNYPVIDGGGSNPTISVLNSSYDEITGLEIINSGSQEGKEGGILLEYSDHIVITNNSIHNNANGHIS